MSMKKILAFALCLVLVAGLSVAGTLAYLQAVTDPITNTFTPTGISIDLIETMNPDGTTEDADGNGIADAIKDWSVQLIPGEEYAKNPVVSVDGSKTSVDIYLFVEFVESVDERILTYTSALESDTTWKKVPNEDDVWYRVVPANTDYSCNLLVGDKVSISNEITDEDLENVTEGTMAYTAFAIQTAGFLTEDGEVTDETVTQAWTEAEKLRKTN